MSKKMSKILIINLKNIINKLNVFGIYFSYVLYIAIKIKIYTFYKKYCLTFLCILKYRKVFKILLIRLKKK